MSSETTTNKVPQNDTSFAVRIDWALISRIDHKIQIDLVFAELSAIQRKCRIICFCLATVTEKLWLMYSIVWYRLAVISENRWSEVNAIWMPGIARLTAAKDSQLAHHLHSHYMSPISGNWFTSNRWSNRSRVLVRDVLKVQIEVKWVRAQSESGCPFGATLALTVSELCDYVD